jgi:hypothetical protein
MKIVRRVQKGNNDRLSTPWNRALLEKLIVTQLVKKFPALYETRRFIAVFTKARQFRRPVSHFVTSWFIYGEDLLAFAQPQAVGPPFVGCPRLLTQYIHSYLHLQPEDVPCRGDSDPHTMD